jgi:energy-coupling factor transporter ATP-binding protein EcfA2
VLPSHASLEMIVYQLCNDGPAVEQVGEGSDAVVAAQHWTLPAVEFDGLWESLVLPFEMKHKLVQYAATSVLFSDAGVDPTLVSLNRLILLHGPPGTGKTTLCKALAQKLALRMSGRYPSVALLEVNSHSLFSRWFSESGKLVGKLFDHIQELVSDDEVLVFVLIDEVESLTGARQAAMAGSEPGDAVRVVNALLTQLDALRAHPNVMILATSNITEAIDAAFVDRADLKMFVPPPGVSARYEVLRSCVQELARKGIVRADSWHAALPSSSSSAAPLEGRTDLAVPAFSSPLPPFQELLRAVPPSAFHDAREQLERPGQGVWPATVSNEDSTAAASTTKSLVQSTAEGRHEAAVLLTATAHSAGPAWDLLRAACHACGLSGRALRKLPFVAHAARVHRPVCSLQEYCTALLLAVKDEASARKHMS